MTWVQIAVEVDGRDITDISAFFSAAGALSVTTMDAGDEPLLEPAPGETPVWKRVRLVALFEAGHDTASLLDGLRRQFPAPALAPVVEELADRDWSTTWRDSFSSMRFGERLWICPTGETCPDPEAVVVRLDPGLAFGTGTHATTALCLEWLDGHAPVGRTVIDYGCGSGVLAIAAHRLGARRVHAIDIDPQALQATTENARRNAVQAGLTVHMPGNMPPDPADLVLANILANPLLELADTLCACLCPGGVIVMTGILTEQAGEVMAAYRPRIDFEAPLVRDEWVLLAGRKR